MNNRFFTIIFIFVFISSYAQVGIGTLTPNSTLSIDGSITTNVEILFSTNITLDETHHTIVASGGTITLPDPDNIIGREYIIKAGSSSTTVSVTTGDVIDSSGASITLSAFESIKVKAIAAGNWVIIKNTAGAKKIDDLSDAKVLNNSVYLGAGDGIGANGSRNTGVGAGALLNADGDQNIAMGYFAGGSLTDGSNNVLLGHGAGSGSSTGITTGDGNILIGDGVLNSGQTVDNELNIGDAIYATGLYGATAKVGIGTNNPSAGLEILGADTGAPVLELNPQSAPVGTATGQLAVIGDLLYMYDATRSKWLSVESTALQFAKNNRQATTDEFLFFGGNLRDGTKSGALMPFDGTVVIVSARRADTDTSAETYLVSINGSTSSLPGNSIEFAAGSQSVNGTSYNIDFNAGDFLNVYTSLSRISYDPAVIVWVKWRK